jgi:predicted O-linked N-acetylglucosamine transferase (SPINDLY family)
MELTPQQAIDLATQLHRDGRLAEAESVFAQIVRARPDWGDAHAQFADVLVAMDKVELAIAALQSAIANNPSNPAMCFSNLSVLFYRQHRYGEAADACRQAIALQPGNPLAHRNLGDALLELRQYESADQSYRTALLLDPGMIEVHTQLGLTLYHRSRYLEALQQFQTTLKFDPANVNACMNAVLCHGRLGDREETETTLRRTIELSPNEPELSSGLVMILNYSHGDDPHFMLKESIEYHRRHIALLLRGMDAGSEVSRRAGQVAEPPSFSEYLRTGVAGANNRPLRIGYVSPDFRHHSVSFFLEPLFRNRDRKNFVIACYAEVEKPDDKTAMYQSQADLWRNTLGQSDEQVAEQIRADAIDILIDLAGHTVNNRLPVFGRRPAPIQITWLGYPNTTGVSTIDYRLTDARADPPGADAFYTEKLIRLADAFFVYQPPQAPAVVPLPMLAVGHATFGSFNNISKITPVMGGLWAQILQAVPGSKLLIAGAAFAAGDRLRAMIEGVSPDRIEIADTMELDKYLELFQRVDIALDSYPWAGHTTTCHALWMGVPVVSLAGPTAVSRAGMSVMGSLGMDREWVANSPEDYVGKAIAWAAKPTGLAALREGLRARMLQSPIMDAPRFARNFENQLRQLWSATK